MAVAGEKMSKRKNKRRGEGPAILRDDDGASALHFPRLTDRWAWARCGIDRQRAGLLCLRAGLFLRLSASLSLRFDFLGRLENASAGPYSVTPDRRPGVDDLRSRQATWRPVFASDSQKCGRRAAITRYVI